MPAQENDFSSATPGEPDARWIPQNLDARPKTQK
jgi:hypothetical protein